MEIVKLKKTDERVNGIYRVCTKYFKMFVREIMGLDNQPFHDELDDDISQEFDENSAGFKMIKRFFAVFTYPRDHGKAQALTSKVLTPQGWTTIGRLKVGDYVMGGDGKPTRIYHLHPISEMLMFEVETYDGRKTLCNLEHLWEVITPSNRGNKRYVKALEDLIENYKHERIDKRSGKSFTEYRHYIPPTPVIEWTEERLILDPYLLGAWLGDGTSASGSITSADPEILSYFPCEVRKIKAAYRYSLLGIRKYLVQLNMLKNKHIPNQYLIGSTEQRLELLRGLMDTNGSCHQDGQIAYFYNTNRNLIDGVIHLVRSLGGNAMCYPKRTKCNDKWFDSWVVSVRLPFNPFKLKRKANKWKGCSGDFKSAIISIKPTEKALARCITVENPDGLYITDDFLVTHNSTHLSIAYPLWRIAQEHNLRILIISRTTAVAESFLSAIVSNIERNEKYKDWARNIDPMGEGVVPRQKMARKQVEDWSGKQITIAREDQTLKDPTICATGLFGQILSRRADIVIFDDVVDQQNSMTELQRQKVIDWIETTVLPVLVPGGTMLYLGNTWHQEDVVSKFLKDPRFVVQKRYGAIVQDATNKELWAKWGSIMLNITTTPKERWEQAEAFYQANKTDMDAGTKVLWPERYPYTRLYLERLLNPYVFARMYQCDPSDRPDQVIKDVWIETALKKGAKLRFQNMPHEGNYLMASAAGMDLAIGQEEQHDDTALIYMDLVNQGYNGIEDGDYIIRQIHRGHFSPREQREYAKVAWSNHGMASIRVESNNYQASLSFDLQEEGVPLTAYSTGTEKFDPEVGINSFAVAMENGKVVIPSDQTDPRTVMLASKLANEMRAFPDGHTGDSLMATWFAYSEIRKLLGSRAIFPRTSLMTIKDSLPLQTPEQRQVYEKEIDMTMIREQEHERSNFDRMVGVFGKK